MSLDMPVRFEGGPLDGQTKRLAHLNARIVFPLSLWPKGLTAKRGRHERSVSDEWGPYFGSYEYRLVQTDPVVTRYVFDGYFI